MTQDARGQLYAGVEAAVRSAVAPLGIPASSVFSQYPNSALLTAIATQGPNPVVVIALGKSAPSRQPIGVSGATINTPITEPNQLQTVALTAVQAMTTPLTITVVSAGDGGKGIGGRVTNAIAAAIAGLIYIPLPDSIEQAKNFTVETPTTLGLTAQLVYVSENENNDLAMNRLYRTDIMYTAQHWRYLEQTVTIIQNVNVSVIIPSFQ
jgi:hypothetical protein